MFSQEVILDFGPPTILRLSSGENVTRHIRVDISAYASVYFSTWKNEFFSACEVARGVINRNGQTGKLSYERMAGNPDGIGNLQYVFEAG